MEAKIVELPAFKFAGVQKRVPMQFEGGSIKQSLN